MMQMHDNTHKTGEFLMEKHQYFWKKPWISDKKLNEIRKKFQRIKESHVQTKKLQKY